MFAQLSLKMKLLVLCGSLLFITMLVGGVSYWGITTIDASYAKIASVSLPNIKTIDKMYASFQQVRISIRTLGLPGLTKAQEEKAVSEALAAIKRYEDEDRNYQKAEFLPGEKELYQDVVRNWGQFKVIGGKVFSYQKSGTNEDREKMVGIFLKECPETAEAYNQSINKLIEFHDKNAMNWVKIALYDADLAKMLQDAIMIVGLLGGLSVGYFFASSISKLLNEISHSLSNGSDKIAVITAEISEASSALSQNIGQQAVALQQTSSAVEQTSASVVSNADNAKKSAEVSEQSKFSVHNGKHAVDDVLNSIHEISSSTTEIKRQIDEGNREIADIVKIINEIGTKTKIINEIVFQTKLLSFNASVEAARAGEHGKGFAVVAEEVGNLARMSGESSKEISELLERSIMQVQATIENSQRKVEAIMLNSQKKVEEGIKTTKKCSEVLDEIISNVNNVDMMISEISSASHEQSHSIREITKAMNEIDSASHQNSSSSHQTTIAAQSLGSQVEDFRELVTKLNAIVGGKKAA